MLPEKSHRRHFTQRRQSTANEIEIIQGKVFRKWINAQLKQSQGERYQIADLFEDIKDGIALWALVEVLSKKKLPNPRHSTNVAVQRCNIASVLTQLEDMGVSLVGINAADVSEGKPCIVLGLIWRIILHFQMGEKVELPTTPKSKAVPTWETDAAAPEALEQPEEVETEMTSLKLKTWVEEVLKEQGLQFRGFGEGWQDGQAFLALIQHVQPGLVDMEQARDLSRRERLEQAFTLADEHLHIPRLLDPADMYNPDPRSIMLYIVQFKNYVDEKQGDAVDAPGEAGMSSQRASPQTVLQQPPDHGGEDLMAKIDKLRQCIEALKQKMTDVDNKIEGFLKGTGQERGGVASLEAALTSVQPRLHHQQVLLLHRQLQLQLQQTEKLSDELGPVEERIGEVTTAELPESEESPRSIVRRLRQRLDELKSRLKGGVDSLHSDLTRSGVTSVISGDAGSDVTSVISGDAGSDVTSVSGNARSEVTSVISGDAKSDVISVISGESRSDVTSVISGSSQGTFRWSSTEQALQDLLRPGKSVSTQTPPAQETTNDELENLLNDVRENLNKLMELLEESAGKAGAADKDPALKTLAALSKEFSSHSEKTCGLAAYVKVSMDLEKSLSGKLEEMRRFVDKSYDDKALEESLNKFFLETKGKMDLLEKRLKSLAMNETEIYNSMLATLEGQRVAVHLVGEVASPASHCLSSLERERQRLSAARQTGEDLLEALEATGAAAAASPSPDLQAPPSLEGWRLQMTEWQRKASTTLEQLCQDMERVKQFHREIDDPQLREEVHAVRNILSVKGRHMQEICPRPPVPMRRQQRREQQQQQQQQQQRELEPQPEQLRRRGQLGGAEQKQGEPGLGKGRPRGGLQEEAARADSIYKGIGQIIFLVVLIYILVKDALQ